MLYLQQHTLKINQSKKINYAKNQINYFLFCARLFAILSANIYFKK